MRQAEIWAKIDPNLSNTSTITFLSISIKKIMVFLTKVVRTRAWKSSIEPSIYKVSC